MSRPKPTRETPGGRAYLDLRRLAAQRGRPTEELLQLYALEGFLARSAISPRAEQLVLKGGVLLAAFDARRPTKDVDLAASSISNHPEHIRVLVNSILEIQADDGLEFTPAQTAAETIREGDVYSGVRVMVPCRLASATVDFHVDVSVGDPIWPGPARIELPRLLGGPPLVVPGLPIAMVLAEKIVTAIQRGTANTRWRDFVDIAALAADHELTSTPLRRSLEIVADHRGTRLESLSSALEGFATIAQPRWAAWRRRLRLEGTTPPAFRDLLDEVIGFADPVLSTTRADAKWNPRERGWEPTSSD